MEIIYHKNFIKAYKKLPAPLKNKVASAITALSKDPTLISLKNHALKGKLRGKRSISVASDPRIIFAERNNYVLVIMLDLGTHNHVY